MATEAEPIPVLNVVVQAGTDSLYAQVMDPSGVEELCSLRAPTMHWLRLDLSNRSSTASKMLLAHYPQGYILQYKAQRNGVQTFAGSQHVAPLPMVEKTRRAPQDRAQDPGQGKVLRAFPFLLETRPSHVVKATGLLLTFESFDLVFGYVARSGGVSILWIRFPEVTDESVKAPMQTVTFGERGQHVVYAAASFDNPIDANRLAERLARKFLESITQSFKGD